VFFKTARTSRTYEALRWMTGTGKGSGPAPILASEKEEVWIPSSSFSRAEEFASCGSRGNFGRQGRRCAEVGELHFRRSMAPRFGPRSMFRTSRQYLFQDGLFQDSPENIARTLPVDDRQGVLHPIGVGGRFSGIWGPNFFKVGRRPAGHRGFDPLRPSSRDFSRQQDIRFSCTAET